MGWCKRGCRKEVSSNKATIPSRSATALKAQRIPPRQTRQNRYPPPLFRCHRLYLRRRPRGTAATLLVTSPRAVSPNSGPLTPARAPACSTRGASSALRSTRRHRPIAGRPPHERAAVEKPADPRRHNFPTAAVAHRRRAASNGNRTADDGACDEGAPHHVPPARP